MPEVLLRSRRLLPIALKMVSPQIQQKPAVRIKLAVQVISLSQLQQEEKVAVTVATAADQEKYSLRRPYHSFFALEFLYF